ncbi:MAG: DUF559 domain-containing protein [Thiobacillus sp.]|uniref:endonuclease domain-containing protein n=1 Tax=Thiobacillus sp. TaxID=924 RepID=UPI002894FABF|nr:DUF559 domain-containing protein [Thiobacillus sp.]MDT3707288.1 DUF559 domain-containing protein [Thiobacillus sp.]
MPPRRLKGIARRLRREATPQERLLWGALRARRFAAFKFRRQVPIGPYIVDFVCHDAKLIVELDGSQHADNTRDSIRDAELERRGFEVLRIWNNELTNSQTSVLEAIWQALDRRCGVEPHHHQSAPSPLVGEGARRADEGEKGEQA